MKSLPVLSPERVDGCFAKGELLIFTVALKLYRLPQVKPCVVCSLLIKSGKRACLEIIIFVFLRSCCFKKKKLNWNSLSSRNRAIADYLRSNGYEEAYSTFKKEAELDMVRR